MAFLVTGGAGFIGSHVSQRLLEAGKRVVIIDEVNDYYNPVFKEANLKLLAPYSQVSIYRGDICDTALLDRVFSQESIKTVIHLGARAGVRPSMVQSELYQRVNYEGTKNLVTRATQAHVQQFIFGSTSAVYGNTTPLPFSETATALTPVSPYAASKLMAEHWLCEHQEITGLPTTILRFFTVYGERGRPDMAPYLFTEAILHQRTIKKFGDGLTSRDYTYIDDIISGIIAATERPFDFEIINLGNHQAVSLNQFLETLEDITGIRAVIESLPAQAGDVNHTLADITKAERLLNYHPTTTLHQGLERFVEWYKRNRL